MERFRKLIVNRGVILLLGFIAFIATCFTFSPESASIPQLWGFAIYFLCGLLLFRSKTDLTGTILFFAPFGIWIFVALTNNPGLFPDVVPLLMITCMGAFYTGAFLIVLLQRRKKFAAIALVAGSVVYMIAVIAWLVPVIVFDRLNESLPDAHVATPQLTFVNHLQDSVTIKSKRISVIDFWFTKCGVCYPNNDYLNDQAAKYKPLGVDFYLVYMGDIDSYKEFQSFCKKSRWGNLIHLYDSMSTISNMLNLEGAPHTLVVSDDKIIYHQAGFSEETKVLEKRKLNDIIMSEVARNADLKNILPGSKNVIDLGEIDPRQDSVFTYRLQNTFSTPLSIQDVKGSCNCLISKWTREPIPSNEYGSISFKLEPDTASADAKTIMIATSSGTAPYTVVNLLYKIKEKGLKK